MTRQSWLSEKSTRRRMLQFMFVVQIIMFWEAVRALVYVVVFWSQGLDVGQHASKALVDGFVGLTIFWVARSLKRLSPPQSPQPA